MTKKIEKLTKKQTNLLAVYRDKWIKIGLSCDPLDKDNAIKAINTAYVLAGLNPPKHFIVCDSPMSASTVASIIKGHTVSKVRASVWEMSYGSHDVGWLSFYSYMRDVLGLKDQTNKLVGLIDISKYCGWWAAYENVAIIQHRHCELHRDSTGRLHNENGMAVKYRDGWGVYMWHGVSMPEWAIEHPENITPTLINDEKNAEVRRVMMQRYGWDKWLKEVKAKLVDKDNDPVQGELYEFVDNDGVKVKILHAQNATPEAEGLFGRKTYKQFYLRVPTQFNKAWEANRWTYPSEEHLSEQEFRSLKRA